MTTTKWALDPAHSEVLFKAKHLMITNVTGRFDSISGTAETEGDDFSTARISFQADIASINTGMADRDTHLKSADFFDAEKYPTLNFESLNFEKLDDSEFVLKGNLTMHGVTKAVSLEAEFGGIAKDPWGNSKAGFTLKGKINRKDWGLVWNVATEAGGVLVGEEIRLSAEVQLTKQA